MDINKEDIPCSFKELRIRLPLEYRVYISRIEKEMGVGTKEAIINLVDFYLIENSFSLKNFKRNLSRRIAAGVDHSFLIQLKLLYTFLGHFLKKIRYI